MPLSLTHPIPQGIIIGTECFGRPYSLAAVAPDRWWTTLWGSSCKLEASPWHSRPIYVWIFENGVDFGPKHFRLPAGDSRQGGPCGAPKVRGGSVMEGSGRKLSRLATSWYQGKGPAIIPWGVGRVRERGILLRETAYFLCRTVFVGHAL